MSNTKVSIRCDALEEMRVEASRLNRSVSWVAQKAWALAKDRLRAMPTGTHSVESELDREAFLESKRGGVS